MYTLYMCHHMPLLFTCYKHVVGRQLVLSFATSISLPHLSNLFILCTSDSMFRCANTIITTSKIAHTLTFYKQQIYWLEPYASAELTLTYVRMCQCAFCRWDDNGTTPNNESTTTKNHHHTNKAKHRCKWNKK